ncbi:MAG TPA: hypothetical protein VGM20_15155 [Gemmatimonadales bacterium]|jgi:hypothetical protein
MRNAWMVMAAATFLAVPLTAQVPARPAPRARAAAPRSSADSAKRFDAIRQRYQQELDNQRASLRRTRDRMRKELDAAGWHGRRFGRANGVMRARMARFRGPRRGGMAMRRNAMANRRPPMAMRGAPMEMRRGLMRPGMMRGPAALGPRGRFGAPSMGNGAMLRRGRPGDSAMAFRGRGGRRPFGDSLGMRRRARPDSSAAQPIDR